MSLGNGDFDKKKKQEIPNRKVINKETKKKRYPRR